MAHVEEVGLEEVEGWKLDILCGWRTDRDIVRTEMGGRYIVRMENGLEYRADRERIGI